MIPIYSTVWYILYQKANNWNLHTFKHQTWFTLSEFLSKYPTFSHVAIMKSTATNPSCIKASSTYSLIVSMMKLLRFSGSPWWNQTFPAPPEVSTSAQYTPSNPSPPPFNGKPSAVNGIELHMKLVIGQRVIPPFVLTYRRGIQCTNLKTMQLWYSVYSYNCSWLFLSFSWHNSELKPGAGSDTLHFTL